MLESNLRALWLTALLVTTVTLERTANANDEIAKPAAQEAREHLTKGTRHYRLREFTAAIDEYKAGTLVEDAAVFYYNLGQCYRQLGRPEDAIWHYQRFLDRADPLPPKYRKTVETFIHDMKVEIEKRERAKPIDPTPILPAPIAPPPARPITGAAAIAPWYTDGVGWGLAGTGAVAAGTTIWLLVDARDLDAAANAAPSQQTQRDLRARASQRRLAGTIVGVAGGLALVAGIVKLAIAPSPGAPVIEKTALDLILTANGVAITGRF